MEEVMQALQSAILSSDLDFGLEIVIEADDVAGDSLDAVVQVINQLTAPSSLVSVSKEIASSGEFQECPICYEAWTDECVIIDPCSHVFHRNCLERWLEASGQCPYCRAVI